MWPFLALVGRPVCFQVQNAASSPVLLSRRAAQLKARNALFAQHHPGDILPAVVTNPARFGAFCDIGCGLVGLLGIENLSISRIRHSQERVQEGQRLFVLLRTMDPETGRVTLSHKELLGTWAQNAAAFQAGQTVTGIVRSKKDYGLFIELAPNLSGLAERRAGLEEGDAVSVYIKSILPQKQKIKLSYSKSWTVPCSPSRPSSTLKRRAICRVGVWTVRPAHTFLISSQYRLAACSALF